MEDQFTALVDDISRRYGLSLEDIQQRVESRRAWFSGWITRNGAARLLAVQAKLELVLGIRHVAGLELADALAAARLEADRGRLATLGYWPHPREPASSIAGRYCRAIDAVAACDFDASVSIKLDRLEFRREAVLPVLCRAKSRRVRLHIDAEDPRTVDRVLSYLEQGLALGADLSMTLPSRWARSLRDAERLVELAVPFRVVKGQGADPDHPDIDPRRSFLELVAAVAGRASHVAVATHDRRLAARALDLLLASGTPCSLEQLRFLPRLDSLAVRRHVPARVYVPYGRPGLPYTLAQVTRRPAILLWVLRDLTTQRLADRVSRISSRGRRTAARSHA